MLTRYQTEFDLYIRLELSGILRCPPGWTGDEHRHAFWEILYAVSGECDIFIEDKPVHLETEQALFVAPMEDHRLTAGLSGTVMAYVGFRCETGRELMEDISPDIRFLPKQSAGHGELTRILNEMAGKTDFQPFGEPLIRALMPAAAWLRERYGTRDGLPGSQKNILCRKTVKYIRSNLHRFVTVEEIASSLYVTPHYLGLVFSACMGQTILKYQQAAKMERAAALIRGGLSLTDISNQLGYSSPQYFSKCFRAYYGFPPNRMKTGSD